MQPCIFEKRKSKRKKSIRKNDGWEREGPKKKKKRLCVFSVLAVARFGCLLAPRLFATDLPVGLGEGLVRSVLGAHLVVQTMIEHLAEMLQ